MTAERAMTVTVLKPKTGELFDLDTHAAQARRRRDEAVRAAMAQRDRAEQAMELAQRQLNAARDAKAEADSELRSLLEKGELFLVGDTAIEVNEHGGLRIRRARVVGLV